MKHNGGLIYKISKKKGKKKTTGEFTLLNPAQGRTEQRDQCTQQKPRRNFEGVKDDPNHIEEVHIQLGGAAPSPEETPSKTL